MNALLLGAAFGAGLLIIRAGWRPRPEPLALALARLDQQRTISDHDLDRQRVTWDIRVGAAALRRFGPLARAAERARQDLRLVGRSSEEQAARTLIYGLFGLLLGPWWALVVALLDAGVPPVVAGTVSMAGAALGMAAPWVAVRRDAAGRRRAFLLALAAWCDMLAMSLAAGRGIDQAVTTAAMSGQGWAFAELRGALSAGHVRGDTPWASLEALGDELGLGDLGELASTITMAGEDGAAIREAVATKAHTIRERITSDTERAAERATAEMGMPTFFVAFGFLVFLGYPALRALSESGF